MARGNMITLIKIRTMPASLEQERNRQKKMELQAAEHREKRKGLPEMGKQTGQTAVPGVLLPTEMTAISETKR